MALHDWAQFCGFACLRSGYQQTAMRYRWQGEDYAILSFGGNITEEEFDVFWEETM